MTRPPCKRLFQPRASGDVHHHGLACLTECQQAVWCENGRQHHHAGVLTIGPRCMLVRPVVHCEALGRLLSHQEVASLVTVSTSLIIMNCRTASRAAGRLSRSGSLATEMSPFCSFCSRSSCPRCARISSG